MGKNKKLRFLGQKGGPKPRRPSVCLSVLSVCVCVIPLFELGATGTRQIWWVCAEFNSKKSDRAIFELAHLFAELQTSKGTKIGINNGQNGHLLTNRHHFSQLFSSQPTQKRATNPKKASKTGLDHYLRHYRRSKRDNCQLP